MRQYAVSLKGVDPVVINYRGCIVVLKEGEVYDGESEIYRFYPKYFEPLAYYKEAHKKNEVIEANDVIDDKPKKKRQSKKTININDFSSEININENDVIIETSNQSKEV